MPSAEGIFDLFRPKLYFWRAFNLGLDLQITNTLPRRRTTLQSRARVLADFNDDRTFIIYRSNSKCVDYTDIQPNCKTLSVLSVQMLRLSIHQPGSENVFVTGFSPITPMGVSKESRRDNQRTLSGLDGALLVIKFCLTARYHII